VALQSCGVSFCSLAFEITGAEWLHRVASGGLLGSAIVLYSQKCFLPGTNCAPQIGQHSGVGVGSGGLGGFGGEQEWE